MRRINLEDWSRRAQFEHYQGIDYPYFNVTVPVEVTGLKEAARSLASTFTIALVYLLSKAANQQLEFRTRLRADHVVEHDVVHPSITVLAEGERLAFCTIPFTLDFQRFHERAQASIEQARKAPSLIDPPGRDDMLFMTSIPWVSFSGIMHPVPLNPADSVPRIAWGKMSLAAGSQRMPLSVQCNHAVMDGLHVGRYYERVESLLANPRLSLEAT